MQIRIGLDASMLVTKRTGIGTYVFNILNYIKKSNSNIEFYLYSDREISDDCKIFGCYIENIGPKIKKGPLWLSFINKKLIDDKIDIFWGGNGYLPLILDKKIKSLLTVHDFVHEYSPQTVPFVSKWSRKILQTISIKHATVITVVSQATNSQMKELHGRDSDLVFHPRVDQIYIDKVSDEKKLQVINKYNLPSEYIFTLGTLEPRKNLVSLLKAYSNLRSEGIELPMLILAGSKGWMDGDLLQLISKLTNEGCVRWIGFVDQVDMPSLYQLSSLFMFVPIYEGFGAPVREALVAGATVIASDIPCIREAGGSSAIYINNDVDSITKIIRKYFDNKSTRPTTAHFDLAENELSTIDDFLTLIKSLTDK